MRRYNFRPLPNRNMATPVPNIENELDPPHPEHPESNPNMEGENNDAQPNRPSSPGTELLRELRIISHELSSKGSSSKITPFDGSDPEKFRTWQREVTKHCAILGLNEDDKKRILYATAHGSVSLFIARYFRENEQCSYKQILDQLTKRFSNMSNKHSAKQAIKNLKQIKNENIQSFYERLIDLAEQAFPDDAMDERGTKDQILTIFTDGLYDPRIRRHVIRKRCNDIQEALMSAINEHDLIAELDSRDCGNFSDTISKTKSEQHVHSKPIHLVQSQKRVSAAQNNHHSASRTPQTFFPQFKQGNAYRQRDPPRCWGCNRTGHFIRTCNASYQMQIPHNMQTPRFQSRVGPPMQNGHQPRPPFRRHPQSRNDTAHRHLN